jgi:hypothetical protein
MRSRTQRRRAMWRKCAPAFVCEMVRKEIRKSKKLQISSKGAVARSPRLALVSEGPRKANRGIVGSRLTALAISPAPLKLSLPFPRASGVIEAVEAVRPAALAQRRCRNEGSSERNQLRHLSQLGSARARMVTPARCRSSGAPWPPGSSLCHVARSGHFK